MAQLICIYWRDIPAQVLGRQGRRKFKLELAPRFAKAIDRAAMRAGKGSSDAYISEWRRETKQVNGDLEKLVQDRVAELEREFNSEFLEALVKAGGSVRDARKRESGSEN